LRRLRPRRRPKPWWRHQPQPRLSSRSTSLRCKRS
jgi:hypothetical protein